MITSAEMKSGRTDKQKIGGFVFVYTKIQQLMVEKFAANIKL